MTPALELRDIHLPDPPGLWPPAPAWWVLAILITLLAIWLWRRVRRHARLRQRRAVLMREFDHLIQRFPVETQAAQLLAEMSQLLRRAARRYAPMVATLQGEDWLGALDGGSEGAPFSQGAGRLLLDGPYRASVSPEALREALPLFQRRLRDWAEQAHV